MTRLPGIPSYRGRIVRGQHVALVTLTDIFTKRRRDFSLGTYGSPASREQYRRVIAAWEERGRRLDLDCSTEIFGLTIAQLCAAFLRSPHPFGKSELGSFKSALRPLWTLLGAEPAESFGPKALRLVREAMVHGEHDVQGKIIRSPWSRGTINSQVNRIRHVFKWAIGQELLPVTVHQRLQAVESLRAGKSEALENDPIGCVDAQALEATRAFLSRHVSAMVDLQLLTGMRPGEVCAMRLSDLDMSGKVWLYRLVEHKTAHRGKRWTVYLGPRAQEIVRPFLCRPVMSCVFSAAEAEDERLDVRHALRLTPLGYGNRPGTNCKQAPRRRPRARYSAESYRRAITRACDQADQAEKDRAAAAGVAIAADSRLVPRWHPHQLRHNYATEIRRRYGLEAAAILLGHASATITDAVYAERDAGKAIAIAAAVG